MKINKILINNLEKPFGFSFHNVNINIKWSEATPTDKYSIKLYENEQLVYNESDISVEQSVINTNISTNPRCEYQVEILSDDQIVATTNFESGYGTEDLQAEWIAGSKEIANNVFSKQLSITKPVAKARLYASCQGVYDAYIDGTKVGDEVLAPGFTNYNTYTQLQTYDITNQLSSSHKLELSVGDGWFKGVLGFEGGESNIYGDVQAIICEIHIDYQDGTNEIICSDTSWDVCSGNTTASAIYYGQDIDLTKSPSAPSKPTVVTGQPLIDRISPAIKVMEQLKPQQLIITPLGEQVIDFGQNHSGWIKFLNKLPAGQKVVFEFGEILQEGNFYRGNLREARARFEVISDGQERYITPNFTFFGYRYVKVTGLDQVNLEDFSSQAIYSDLDFDTELTTDNQKVNQLLSNINWGQKSNFIDIPTDCPQRDERLGWTGDANIFGKTALISSNVVQFYKKYLADVRVAQGELDGKIPMYAPTIGHADGGAAVWSDVITMLPWNIYLQTGDTEVLKQNFEAMKAWVGWVQTQTSQLENQYIWTGSFQFGDWLALDGLNPSIPSGGTDENFIATVYYYMSADIIAKTAMVLNKEEDAQKYSQLANNIKTAILEEYITASGKMTLNTQTGYALILESGILAGKQLDRVVRDLIFRLNCDSNLIQTGFVGTPLLCPALSKNGYHELATKIFLNEQSPSWLYAVNMGATTIWERWNSVQEDGSMNPDGMNSLNHYAYGAIKSWVVEHLLGICNTGIGYDTVTIKPGINPHLSEISGTVRANGGYLKFAWKQHFNKVVAQLTIPVGTVAKFECDGLIAGTLKINGQSPADNLTAGSYTIEYQVDDKLTGGQKLSLESSLFDLSNNRKIWEQLVALKPQLGFFGDKSARTKFGTSSLAKVARTLPFINFTSEEYLQIEQILDTKKE